MKIRNSLKVAILSLGVIFSLQLAVTTNAQADLLLFKDISSSAIKISEPAESSSAIFGNLKTNEFQLYKFTPTKDGQVALRLAVPQGVAAAPRSLRLGIIEAKLGPQYTNSQIKPSDFKFAGVVLPQTYNKQFSKALNDTPVWIGELQEGFFVTDAVEMNLKAGEEYYMLVGGEASFKGEFAIFIDENYRIPLTQYASLKLGYLYGSRGELNFVKLLATALLLLGLALSVNRLGLELLSADLGVKAEKRLKYYFKFAVLELVLLVGLMLNSLVQAKGSFLSGRGGIAAVCYIVLAVVTTMLIYDTHQRNLNLAKHQRLVITSAISAAMWAIALALI